jgi:DNA polymerase-3 subunit delta
MAMPHTVAAFDYLAQPNKHSAAPVCAVFGEETFLRRLALKQLREQVLAGADAEFSLSRFDGDAVSMRDVLDELSTVALFGGGRRLVVLEEANEFVSRHRAELEDYVARPKSSSVLVLDVSVWPKNTRLYKLLDAEGLQIDCKTPEARSLIKWLVTCSQERHSAKLQAGAAEVLVELVGPDLGLLDQELAKLAVSAEKGKPISERLVQDLVGGWRARTAWEMIDAALAGQTHAALAQLDRLLLSGENAIGILAQIGFTLRRFAAAVRLVEQAEAQKRRINLREALEQAGVKPFVLAKSEEQLRRLGRQRAGQLYRRLLEADLDLKGKSELPPRVILERLIVRLAILTPAAAR